MCCPLELRTVLSSKGRSTVGAPACQMLSRLRLISDTVRARSASLCRACTVPYIAVKALNKKAFHKKPHSLGRQQQLPQACIQAGIVGARPAALLACQQKLHDYQM